MHEISEFLQFSEQGFENVEELKRGWMSLGLEEAGPTGLHKPLYQEENWSTNTSGVCNTNSQVLCGHLATFQKLGFAKNTRTFYTNLLLR
jgi:hypothetical protein